MEGLQISQPLFKSQDFFIGSLIREDIPAHAADTFSVKFLVESLQEEDVFPAVIFVFFIGPQGVVLEVKQPAFQLFEIKISKIWFVFRLGDNVVVDL